MLVLFHKTQISYDKNDCLQVVDESELTNFLVKYGNELFSLLPELVKCMLLFQKLALCLSTAFSLTTSEERSHIV